MSGLTNIVALLLAAPAVQAIKEQGNLQFPSELGSQIAYKALGTDASNLKQFTTEQLELLEDALNSAYESNPLKFIAQLQPKDSKVKTRPPPLLVSKKEGFTIHSHPDFPNYELRVKSPDLKLDSVQQYSGYIDILDEDKHLFFWLWESRSNPKKDPVVLWLNGGPGCSSATGEFFELGPAMVATNLSTTYNPYAWNNHATMIFLDQPVNVGYSYSSERVSESSVAGEDVYSFLEVLFDALPQYAGLPFHISGESYAGKYLPAIGKAILDHPERSFDLKSALIGNPITDPAVQAFSSVAMACGDGGYPSVLDAATCESLWKKVPRCENLWNMCYDSGNNDLVCAGAFLYCSQLEEPYMETGRNPYDISQVCYDKCYPEIDAIEEFMRQPEIIKAVGSDVDDFVGCSDSVGTDFLLAQDMGRNEGPDVLAMLDAGVDVLFYDGAYDWICSWPGVYRLVERFRYEKHAEFNAAPLKVWYVDGKAAGETKSAGHLSWMKIYEAGHMVPHDKGKQALVMFNQWISKQKFY